MTSLRFGFALFATLIGTACSAPATDGDVDSTSSRLADGHEDALGALHPPVTVEGTDAEFLLSVLQDLGLPATHPAPGSSGVYSAYLLFSTAVYPGAPRRGGVYSPNAMLYYGEIPASAVERSENIIEAAGAPLRGAPEGYVGAGRFRTATVSCQSIVTYPLAFTCTIDPNAH